MSKKSQRLVGLGRRTNTAVVSRHVTTGARGRRPANWLWKPRKER